MPGKIRCTIVKTPSELEATRAGADAVTQDLLPWSDPFIARLVAKYRLRAALDDSLHYLTHESAIPRTSLPRADLSARASQLPQANLPHEFPRVDVSRPAGILPSGARRFTFPLDKTGPLDTTSEDESKS